MAGPFLISHYFLLLGFLPQKPLADFPLWDVLKSWPLVFLFSRLLDPIFSYSTFGCLSLYHFLQVSWFLPTMLKVSQPPSFMVLFFGFPQVPTPCSWIVGSQAFWFIFCIIGWLIGTYLLPFLVFLGPPPLNCLNPTLALLHVPGIPGSSKSPSIPA